MVEMTALLPSPDTIQAVWLRYDQVDRSGNCTTKFQIYSFGRQNIGREVSPEKMLIYKGVASRFGKLTPVLLP